MTDQEKDKLHRRRVEKEQAKARAKEKGAMQESQKVRATENHRNHYGHIARVGRPVNGAQGGHGEKMKDGQGRRECT